MAVHRQLDSDVRRRALRRAPPGSVIGLSVVDVTDGSDIDMRLRAIELLVSHGKRGKEWKKLWYSKVNFKGHHTLIQPRQSREMAEKSQDFVGKDRFNI